MSKKYKAPKEDEIEFFSPTPELLKSIGYIGYDDKSHSWSIIRLKREILNQASQLSKRLGPRLVHMIVVCKEFQRAKQVLTEMEKKGKITPMLLFFGRIRKEE